MNASPWPVVLTIASVLVTSAQGQVVRELTPEQIRDAIDVGTRATEVTPYEIQERARWSWPPLIAVYTTPFLRVALAAHTATKRHTAFTEADVTPEMVESVIHVYARSQPLEGGAIANVETVIVLPYDSKDTSKAVRPARMHVASEEYKELFGLGAEGRAMLAVFPLDVWREDSEVHVVFDKRIPSSHGPRARGGCTDCKSRIHLERVREGSVSLKRGIGGATASPDIELGAVVSRVWPNRNSGKFESRRATAASLWGGYRFRPGWALEINLVFLNRQYETPEAVRNIFLAHVDERMNLTTLGAEVGLRALPTLHPLELVAGAGVGLYRSKLAVTGTSVLFPLIPGEAAAEKDWGAGLRLCLGADVILGSILGGNARLGLEYRYLRLRGDFGDLSGGDVAIGGPQASLRLLVLY